MSPRPTAAKGHMPFPGHRTQKQILDFERAQFQALEKHRERQTERQA